MPETIDHAVTTARTLLDVTVERVTVEADDIRSFVLVSADGDALPVAPPGAHLDVHLPGGTRQYSIYNAGSDENCYRIAVLMESQGRGGSLAMHQLQPGTRLSVSAPRDRFPLSLGQRHYVLIAGGIGVTPILSMAEELYRQGRSFEFHYANRSAARAAFTTALHARPYSDRLRLYVDETNEFIDLPSVFSAATGQDPHVYVCGPPGLIDAVYNAAEKAGLSENVLHSERFQASATPPAAGVSDSDRDRGPTEFEVVINSTGQRLMVDTDHTVAQVLVAAGVDLPLSCEEGICGTCETGVLAGIPKHNDEYFTKDEKASNRVFTPCCSRSLSSTLVLDL